MQFAPVFQAEQNSSNEFLPGIRGQIEIQKNLQWDYKRATPLARAASAVAFATASFTRGSNALGRI